MLHFKCLEYLAFLLQYEDGNSGLIELPSASLRTPKLFQGCEDVLYMENCTLAIDLFNETEFMELHTHNS